MCVSRAVESSKQSGAALIAFLLIFVTAASFALLKGLNETATQHHRDAQTAEALAEAKAALIGYAVSRAVTPAVCSAPGNNCSRPGDLPCPDRDNTGDLLTPTGSPEPHCGNASGSTDQPRRIGRLPWRSLGLADLRDGDGERLWYAVSTNFKNNTRSSCTNASAAGCLNSNVRGTITVYARNGTLIHDGRNQDPWAPSGLVAVVFAPGKVLRRQGATRDQDRSCTGGSCNANDACTSLPATNTRKCSPREYLDIAHGEDNATFYDGPIISNRTNGFIEGAVFDLTGNLIVNDKILAITYQDLIPLLEKRVVGEVLTCLRDYAVDPANSGRFPWAAPLGGAAPSYLGVVDARFGRVPDPPLTVMLGMENSWPSACNVNSGINWWFNWKELLFYGVADAYKPTALTPPSCASSSCLTVDPPSPVADRQVAVIAAGKRLAGIPGGQPRSSATDKGIVSNYLEDNNASQPSISPYTDDSFTATPTTATFNDVVCKQGVC